MENNYVRLLKDVSKKDLLIVGGKAANLGEMIKSGLPVPEGFVLVIDSYKEFIEFNNMKIKIKDLYKNLDNNEYENVKRISKDIKELFQKGKIPEKILDEINQNYEKMESAQVAVRSSGTREDSPDTSFAGLYDSFLNVHGKEQLHRYIKLCWASLWNTQAISYRLKHNIKDNNLANAVVIQELMKAKKSGILFTANPLNNKRDQILINSAWGLGEAIVSGDVTPDQWIVDKTKEKIVEEKITEKRKMTVCNDNGTKLVDVPYEKQNKITLDHSEVQNLIELAKKSENHFEKPQDIEWAVCDNKFYIVQSRPITTLFPKVETDNNEELRIYINFLLIDKVMPEPLTPIGKDIWVKYLKKILPAKWVKSAAGRIFVDITELSRLRRWWEKLRDNSYAMDPLTTQTMLKVLEKNKDILKQERRPLFKLIPTLFSFISPSFLKFILTSMSKALYGILFPGEKVVDKAYEYGENQIKSLKQRADKLTNRKEKIEFIENNALKVYYYIPLQVLYYVINSITYLEKAKRIINKHLENKFNLSKVEKSLPNNVTTEMGLELLEIAKKLDKSGEQPQPSHPEIKKFLNKYGHRTYLEIDPGVSRWKEDPEYIINLIRSYIDNKSYKKRIKKFYQDKEEAEKTIQEITINLKEKGAHREAKKVKNLLQSYRKLFGVRELPKYIMSQGVEVFREILLDLGEELMSEGRLESKDDIFFITFNDLKSEVKLQEIALRNRKIYYNELKRSSVPRVVTSKGETFYSPDVSRNNDEFDGIPVSPGIYEGQVKVLEYPEEGTKLNEGDILITKATNPAWTPLFLKIGGLITEMGGPISHGSVVAREYGVPAIAGVNEATTRFKDGQIIRINGETGKVEILSEKI